jgi:8-oxo-dGTP diphosphatase
VSADFAHARTVSQVDWSRWTAVDRATLVFVVQDDDILLIEKKRGLGRGKVNGPGGKVDPGESVIDCARRECREELGIEVRGLEVFGEHRFQFVNGYSIHCWVYRAAGFDGEPVETPEAAPLWRRIDDIPYDRMWEDDRLWLPLLLARRHFRGDWIFDDDSMLDYELKLLDGPRALQSAAGER